MKSLCKFQTLFKTIQKGRVHKHFKNLNKIVYFRKVSNRDDGIHRSKFVGVNVETTTRLKI